ncbi:MAG: hypothetical protein WBP61_07845 [Nocardioides sp.]
MKTALTIAALALALAGCGSDDSSDDTDSGAMPTDASNEEFCGNFTAFAEDLAQFGPDADPAEAVEVMQSGADDIRETGVPENATEQEQEGLEVVLDAIDSLPADTTLEDIGKLEDGLSEADQEASDAFDDYLETECADLQ